MIIIRDFQQVISESGQARVQNSLLLSPKILYSIIFKITIYVSIIS